MAGRTLTRAARETIVAILTRNDAEWIAIFGSYGGDRQRDERYRYPGRFARKKPFSLVRIEDETARLSV